MKNLKGKTKLLCIILSITFTISTSHAQQFLTTVSGWNAYVHLPDDYQTTTVNYPIIIFIPGVGEVGTTASKLLTYGPSKFIAQGASMNFTVNGVVEKPIVVSIQPSTAWPPAHIVAKQIDSVVKRWRVDTNRIYLTGLSMGGWSFDNYITANQTYAKKPAAMVIMSAPESNYALSNYSWYANEGGKWWGFEGTTDYRELDQIRDQLNNTVPGSARYTLYTGGHCCWNNWYNPTWTAPDGESIYTWMLKQTKATTPPPPPNIAPVASAGNDITITLPVNSTDLMGSATDVDGTIASYQWTKISGPAGYSIAAATLAQTSVGSLTEGVYEFELAVTDDDGAIDKDTVSVTVLAAIPPPPPNQAPVASAGNDITITLPVNSADLMGSATDVDGTIASYQWTKISGPAGYSIAAATLAQTSVGSLTEGVYEFELAVTDDDGAIDKDTVQITVLAAIPPPPPNQAPVASAGNDITITLPVNTATLNGSATDVDGTITSYQWTKISGPAGYSIAAATLAQTSVGSLTEGVYEFELAVTDDDGAIDKDTVSVTVLAAIPPPPPNQAPVASAGNDITITLPVNNADLNGSATDVDGTIASYQWTKISGPAGYSIAAATLAQTSVGSLTEGVYEFELAVTDDDGAIDKDTVQITVLAAIPPPPPVNIAPVANAGNDISITLPVNSATLNGSATDVDGTIASYQWTKISGPGGYSIAAATLAQTSVGSLTEGVYEFELAVTDDDGAIGMDTVQITVLAAIPPPPPNIAPVASAGNDITITLPVNSTDLMGSATDVDGTIASYQWTKISGPAGYSIAAATLAQTSVTSLEEGVYEFELAVSDDDGAIGMDTVQVTVLAAIPPPPPNIAPVASAGNDITITLPVNSADLMGSATDVDGTIASYQWSKISGPAGYSIAAATLAQTSVGSLEEGVYEFELTVTDDDGAVGMDTVQITVLAAIPPPPPNIAPVASAGNDITITLPVNSADLMGSATDVDGTIASYQWTKISGPAGYSIAAATLAQTSVGSLEEGVYEFELTVTDDDGAIGMDTVQITVLAAIPPPPPNIAPVASAGNDITITLPVNSIDLMGSATDVDGTIASYQWTKVSGPAGYSIAAATLAQTSVGSLTEGVYEFELTVTDDDGAIDKDTVQITVLAVITNCNTAAPVVYTIAKTSSTEIYIPNASTRPWKGGDTLRIPAGNYDLIVFGNFQGDSCRPITIINYGGQVRVKQMRFINNASYFHVSGAGSPSHTYGFKVNGTANAGVAMDLAHHVEINNVEVSGTEVGFYFKKNPVTSDILSQYPNYTLTDYYIHHNYIHGVHGEGMYIGHTYPNADPYHNNLIPIRMGKVEIAYNIVDSTDWDGIQLSNAREDAKIHHNIVTNFGLINMGSQQAGIILGGNTNGDIYDNEVRNGTGNGIEAFGYGLIKIYNNIIENAGHDGTAMGQESVYCNDHITQVESNPKQQIYFYNNIVKNPKPKGAIRIGAYNNNSLPAQVYNNQYCIPNAPANWLTMYVAVHPSGSTVNNNVLMTNCAPPPPPPNQAPVASAGNDISITLPVNSATLNGSATDVDGTIASYQWTKISGPAGYSIAAATLAQTSVGSLTEGVYEFELMVSDDDGAIDKDTVKVTVNAATPPPPVNIAPVANAGNDITITLPVNSATLNGSATDVDGTIASYQWTKISGPAGYSIAAATLAQTSVGSLNEGVYEFELAVTDDDGAIDKDTVQITVLAAIPPPPPVNIAPVANAGNDITITLPVNSATLNGSATDVDGTIASYQWTKISGPAGYSIAAATLAQTSVGLLTEGVYEFELMVSDDDGAIDKDTVKVFVNAATPPPPVNIAPVANAGNDISITLPVNSATLNGSATDVDGTIASYQWTKISGSAGYTIAAATLAQTSVGSLTEGVYEFELMVSDDDGAIDKDTVKVTVNAATPPPPVNIAPVANAGNDISITLPVNSATLNGSATDVDGTIASYQWTKISGPAGYSIAAATLAQTSVGSLTEGVYEFELMVSDDDGAIDKDTVKVFVNAATPPPPVNIAPVANAGNDISITLPVNSATLNGSATDIDGTIASYQWTKISGPAGYSIAAATLAQTSVGSLTEGVYEFELMVSDDDGAIDKDTVKVTVNAATPPPPVNIAPVANAGNDISITLPVNSATLNGSATDVDGTIASYQWTKISGPAGYSIAAATLAQTSVGSLEEGVYEFELTVTDDDGAIDKDTVQITVLAAIPPPPPNIAPVANAGNDITITLPVNSADLMGSATDVDGTIASYQWTKVSGPAGYSIVSSNQAQTVVSSLEAGVYRFELEVTDNGGLKGKDTVAITVIDSSVFKISIPELTLYPNPTPGNLTVRVMSETEGKAFVINIYSSAGIVIYRSSKMVSTVDEMKLEIDLSRFSAGNYFVELQYYNQRKIVQKVIKQ